MRALIIDDDEKLSELLGAYFKRFNIDLLVALTPMKGLELLQKEKPDVVILDVMLPGEDGFSVCRKIRTFSQIPVIMLTARGDTTDKIVGLEIGADDYLSKPFEPRELVARMNSITRRQVVKEESDSFVFGDLEIKPGERNAYLKGSDLELTSNEYELLLFFAKNIGKKIDRDEIMNHLNGVDSDVFSRSVDILVSRLRQKLNDDSKNPRFIKTAWGTGYVFLGDKK